ncbi:unnamed protein product, partial [Rotaria magnacalcarata]
KLYKHDLDFHSTNQKGEKRSHENLSSFDGNDIVDLNDSNDIVDLNDSNDIVDLNDSNDDSEE